MIVHIESCLIVNYSFFQNQRISKEIIYHQDCPLFDLFYPNIHLANRRTKVHLKGGIDLYGEGGKPKEEPKQEVKEPPKEEPPKEEPKKEPELPP